MVLGCHFQDYLLCFETTTGVLKVSDQFEHQYVQDTQLRVGNPFKNIIPFPKKHSPRRQQSIHGNKVIKKSNPLSPPYAQNTLFLPIDKMLYIYLLCPHSEHQKKFRSNLNSLNTFTKGTSSPNKLKLPKIGSNAIVPVRVGAGPNERKAYAPNSKRRCSLQHVI